jgi:phosphate transport system permease protein
MTTNPYNPGATHVLPGGDDAFAGVDLGELEKNLLRPRNFFSFFCSMVATLLTFAAIIPLISVLVAIAVRGLQRLNWETLSTLPPNPIDPYGSGGFANAILGTLVIVAMAICISVPIGILSAIYLAELNPKSRLADALRFCAKTLTGFPSILAGVFAFGVVVILNGGACATAGAVGLSILMIPVILLTAEDAIKSVPYRMKEAAIGMGATKTQVIWKILLPTAFPGILTGIMLAVARAAGETAPLLLTVGFAGTFIGAVEDLGQPTASLAVLINNFAISSIKNQNELAWAAALVLVALVLVFNLIGQSLSPKTQAR